jgi:O-antigen/teichoic acid export membrane protein
MPSVITSPLETKPNLRARVMRGGLMLLAAKGVTQVCSFLRNVIVARIIGVENFGVAATFSVTIAILDIVGNLSVDKLLVQAQDGDDERLQSAAHAVQALRGAASAFLIVLFAWPMAKLFGIPQAAWAFRFIALIPLLRGLVHLDQQRVQRNLDYRAAVGLEVAQQVITTLLAWPLSIWLRDYSAMLWLLVLQYAVPTVGSFLIADRPYRWHWDSAFIRRFFSFGWPLVINSVLLFGVFQGDRFLIGSAKEIFGSTDYSLRDLGIYSVAMSLTITPTLALSNICLSLILPIFSPLQKDLTELTRKYSVISQLFGLFSGLFALPFIVAGEWLVIVIYSRDYAEAGTFIGWLAATQAVRMVRLIPTTAAMAYADTRNAMVANIARTLALVTTVGVILYGGALKWVAFSGFCGEILGLVVCLWKLRKDHHIPISHGAKPAMLVVGYLGLCGSLMSLFENQTLFFAVGLAVGLTVLFAVLCLVLSPALRSLARFRRLNSAL